MAFWTDDITKLSPRTRLRRALDARPVPAAYGHAAIALNKMIRAKIRAKDDPAPLLRNLYSLLCEDTLLNTVIVDPDLRCTGASIAELVDRMELDNLDWPYEKIGLLFDPGPEATRWFHKFLGPPPTPGLCAFTYHRGVWDRARARMLERNSWRRIPALMAKARLSAWPFPARAGSMVEVRYDFDTPGSVDKVTIRVEVWGRAPERISLSRAKPATLWESPSKAAQAFLRDESGQTDRDYVMTLLPAVASP